MASAARLACALAGLAAGMSGWAADVVSGTYTSLPGGYSPEFSVFHMAVVEQLGTVSSAFAASDDPRLRPLTRLDSTWNLSSPFLPLPTRVGDGVSSATLWDEPVRIGGIQFGSFQPALPDVVAPPSAVVLPADSVTPGAGSTRVIDHLRSLVQFQTQSLIAAGQTDFSVESGRLRENFELRSADYGPWITSGSYRYGFNADTTLNGQIAQVFGQQSVLGVGVLEGVGPLGQVSANIAGSRDPDNSGWLARMAYDYTRNRLSIVVRSHVQSPGFLELGDTSTLEPFRQRTLASARVDLGSLGRLSMASATQTYVDDSRRDVIALSHAMPFGGGGVVSTAAAYSPGQSGNSTLLLSFTYPFDYIEAPDRKITGAVNSALDRSIVDAFGPPRLPVAGRSAIDEPPLLR